MPLLRLLSRFKHLTTKLGQTWKIFLHPGTPFIAKFLLSCGILGYIVMPIDAIPDFFIFFGLTDDVIVIPLLIWIFMKFVPQEVKEKIYTKKYSRQNIFLYNI